MSLSAIGTDSFNNALKIIQEIQRYQTVNTAMLDFFWIETFMLDNIMLRDQIEKKLPNKIKLSKKHWLSSIICL